MVRSFSNLLQPALTASGKIARLERVTAVQMTLETTRFMILKPVGVV
jgi:hypothetical protein